MLGYGAALGFKVSDMLLGTCCSIKCVEMMLDKFRWEGYRIHMWRVWLPSCVCAYSFLLFVFIKYFSHQFSHIVRIYYGCN